MTFSKETLKALAALKKVEASAAWQKLEAYIIVKPNVVFSADKTTSQGGNYGKLKVCLPSGGYGTGKVKVFAWLANDLEYFEGYDLSACVAQMDFWGDKAPDNGQDWRNALECLGYTVIQAI